MATTKKKLSLITLYGVRDGNNMLIYKDKQLKQLKCRFIDHYYMKDQIIKLNCFDYWLKVVKKGK